MPDNNVEVIRAVHTQLSPSDRSAPTMFEKSLYDLIKGLRSHKGAENEYIQDSLRECKVEVKSQDMDKKATAVLKLVYLEMFGYDMSWASFHVLEVMSSSSFLQKRVGYVGAAQSFRPDTDVLMLATNLLKKDLTSSNMPNVSLPLTTLPHITSPSLTLSLLPDILARLSHSHSVIRKKAVVSLYRLSLIYPDALKLAWPKIKERLMDDCEDGSVTTAVINVVCELGWRRPRDFLPLAPRFFDLLVDGGNNWMAIKIIKLFATLTSVEPRLVRKLLRPLANIIETTTAMSLLYESINGIIHGGILDGDEYPQEKDEIASLCVGKLRGMVVMDADPNLKYVALLAFNRIAISHPALVSMQQDVIMDCLEDEDISIRFQALDLAAVTVSSATLQFVVNRLVDQLRGASVAVPKGHPATNSKLSDDSNLDEQTELQAKKDSQPYLLPNDYRVGVLHRIIDICSRDNYSEMTDFEWYIDVLVQLIALLPRSGPQFAVHWGITNDSRDVATRIGLELRNIAVRVKSARIEATRAAESLVLIGNRKALLSSNDNGVLGPAAWVVGEYAEFLAWPERTLWSLVDTSNASLPAGTLSLYLQAIPKVLVRLTCGSKSGSTQNALQKNEASLFLTRVIDFLEVLAVHPDLDVQERSVEFLEILRLVGEALHSEASQQGMPALLFYVMPSLFSGLELKPVATSAQRKVPSPEKLILDHELNKNLAELFDYGHDMPQDVKKQKSFHRYYYSRDTTFSHGQSAGNGQSGMIKTNTTYQNIRGGPAGDSVAMAKRGAERRERNRDDPFYIDTEDSSARSTLFHQILNASNGDELDVDSIPIVDLAINNEKKRAPSPVNAESNTAKSDLKRTDIAVDETIGGDDLLYTPMASRTTPSSSPLLQVHPRGLEQTTLEGKHWPYNSAPPRGKAEEEDEDMMRAVSEVERARLGMQRSSERIGLRGTPTEGEIVKKRKKKDKQKQKGSVQQKSQQPLS